MATIIPTMPARVAPANITRNIANGWLLTLLEKITGWGNRLSANYDNLQYEELIGIGAKNSGVVRG